jgi:hypothetical protein
MNPTTPTKSLKKRKELVFTAFTSILMGVFGLIGIAIIYLKWGYRLCELTVEQHPDTHWFVFAFKVMVLMVCPSLCLLLIIFGSQILFYFKKERDKQNFVA